MKYNVCFYMYLLTNLLYYCNEHHSNKIYYMITIHVSCRNTAIEWNDKKSTEAFRGRVALVKFIKI